MHLELLVAYGQAHGAEVDLQLVARRGLEPSVLLEACADAGIALVFVSHDARLASRFQRRVDLDKLNLAVGRQPQEEAA